MPLSTILIWKDQACFIRLEETMEDHDFSEEECEIAMKAIYAQKPEIVTVTE